MKNKLNINFSVKYGTGFQNLKFSKREAFIIFLEALTFLLNYDVYNKGIPHFRTFDTTT